MTCSCVNTLFGDSAGDESFEQSPACSCYEENRHQVVAIYIGNMYHQSPYVDANNPYVVARSPNEHVVSASPSFINNTSNYVQQPVHNLYASSSNFGNMQHMYPNPHASATPEIYMPMNNRLSLVNQVETPYVGAFSNIQQSVSPFYASASSTQYVNSSMNTPMDKEIGHATTSYLANYPQTPYATSYVTNIFMCNW